MAHHSINWGAEVAREFSVEYNVLADCYDDHASMYKIIRVTDKMTDKFYEQKLDAYMLLHTYYKDEKSIYVDAFRRLAEKLSIDRKARGLDPITGLSTRSKVKYEMEDYKVYSWPDLEKMNAKAVPPPPPEPVDKIPPMESNADLKARMKLPAYGRY